MIYGLIPARSGSKGVSNKNIKLLGGHPLLAYSVIASNLCEKIDGTYVTTDSDEYESIAKKYGAVAISRPKYAASDIAGDIDYLLHFIYYVHAKPGDLIVLLRPTTPLREIDLIELAIDNLKNNDLSHDSVRSIHKLNESPHKMFKLLGPIAFPYMNNTPEDANKPRQNFVDCYQPNGYVDVIKVSTILKTKTTYGNKIIAFKTDKVVEVDSQDDFDYLEYKIKNGHPLLDYLEENYGSK